MTALAEFINFCVVVFIELVQITIDLICLPFLVAALLMPWRAPFLLFGLCTSKTCGNDWRDDYRMMALTQCFIGVFEGVTLLVLPIVAFSGLRTAKLLEKICSRKGKGKESKGIYWNGELLGAIWEQFFKLLRDLVPACFLFLALAMPWRWPYLARGLKRHGTGWLFQTILPSSTAKADRKDEGTVLSNWIGQALLGLLDLFTALPFLFVCCTGIRTRKLFKKLASDKIRKEYDEVRLARRVRSRRTLPLPLRRLRAVARGAPQDVEYNYAARALVWNQFASLLVDLLFVPLALVVLLSGWRSLSLLQLQRDPKLKGMRKRGR